MKKKKNKNTTPTDGVKTKQPEEIGFQGKRKQNQKR